MNGKELDTRIGKAADALPAVSPALLTSIAAGLKPAMRPVKPLAPTWVLATRLFLAAAGVAFVSAASAGLAGVESLGLLRAAVILAALALLLGLAATEQVHSMIPGSRRLLGPLPLVLSCCLALAALFAAEFHDYRTTSFVASGIACLIAGLERAIPAGILVWLLMRRGFAINPVAAGATAGAVAGLAGVVFLELHCTNFETLHILAWHTAVLPASAVLGAAAGALAWAASRLRTRSPIR